MLKTTDVLHQVGDFDGAGRLLDRRDDDRVSLLLVIEVDVIRHGNINLGQRVRHYSLVVGIDGGF